MNVRTVDPATGTARETELRESDQEAVTAACRRAAQIFAAGVVPRELRSDFLRASADALQAHGSAICQQTQEETALTSARLEGELTRVCYQLRLFADVVEDGGYLEAIIDHAGTTPMGPRPDVRRMLVPTGPVAVFGASNFPLAFSIPGGDTVAALAAGCPVVVKAHPAHPLTSALTGSIIREAAESTGLPADILQVVYGLEAGQQLVVDEHVTAVSFTGSLATGKALMDLINQRETPIPFFGELSAINPAIVTRAAAAERASAIAEGIAGAVTGSAGQLCTKPGVVLVPEGTDGDRVVQAMADALRSVAAVPLLTSGIAEAFRQRAIELSGAGELLVAAEAAGEFEVGPFLVEVNLGEEPDAVWEETFGPATTIVRYADDRQLLDAIGQMPGTLSASIHHADGEDARVTTISKAVEPLTGRLVYNAQTTGVAVTWAQHHGGPWPATTSQHTSVGPTAIRRFMRPVAWQDAPEAALPEELRDASTDVPRRVDGVFNVSINGDT